MLLQSSSDDQFTTGIYLSLIDKPGSQRLRGQDGKPEQERKVRSYIEKRVEHTNKCKRGAEGNGMP